MRLVIFGAGGLGREILRHARRTYEEIVFADDKPSPPILGTPVIDPTDIDADDELVVAIGNSPARKAIIARFPDVRLGCVFAETCVIGDDAEFGEGAVFCEYTTVTASARIGRDFQCNAYSYVAHDCVVGDHVTFGPRVSCNGNVHIGDGAHLGSGANIRNGMADRPLVIGDGAFVAMGAVVTKDVPPGIRVGGRPARQMN